MASAPVATADAASETGGRSERSTRRSATSVLGSRPTSRAATVSPPGERDGELALFGQGLVGGDDEPRPPDEAARAPAAGVDRDEARRGLGDEAGERGGQVLHLSEWRGFGHGASGPSRRSMCHWLGAPPTAQVGSRRPQARAERAKPDLAPRQSMVAGRDLAKGEFRGGECQTPPSVSPPGKRHGEHGVRKPLRHDPD